MSIPTQQPIKRSQNLNSPTTWRPICLVHVLSTRFHYVSEVPGRGVVPARFFLAAVKGDRKAVTLKCKRFCCQTYIYPPQSIQRWGRPPTSCYSPFSYPSWRMRGSEWLVPLPWCKVRTSSTLTSWFKAVRLTRVRRAA